MNNNKNNNTSDQSGLDLAFTRTDVGNAARFVTNWRHCLRYRYANNTWLIWTGVRWQVESCGEVLRYAKNTARNILDEAKARPGDEALARHAIASQRRERLTAMIDLARPDLAVAPDACDRDPWLLNVLNGVIDLRTGQLRPHDPHDLITHLAPVEFSEHALAPRWHDFLLAIFNHNENQIAYLQRFHGYALTGIATEQFMPVYHGSGANGKSTMLDTIARVMGDYCDTAPPDLLLQRRGDEHPTELADLMGKRLVIASESERNRKLRLQLVKRLTGDATLKARFMRQDFFSFERTFKVILVTNNRPQVDEDSEAAWRRLRLIPFDVVIPSEQRDTRLAEKLREEAPGILRWLVEGARQWQRLGIAEPDTIAAATDSYRTENDPLAEFMDDCCEMADAGWTSASDLRCTYELYCHDRGDPEIGGREFNERLRRRGVRYDRRRSIRGWAGIRIRGRSGELKEGSD